MKKLFLAAVLLGSAVCANAQEDFATQAGTFATEIQFNPFSGQNVFSNGGVFSGTYFCTDKFALMFDLGLSGTNKKNPQYDQDDKEVSFTRTYNGTFTFGIGAKYYFYNYKRVNLYAGAKVSYIHKFAGNKSVTDIKNDYYTWNNNGTGNGFGAYAITGIDFSIYKGLYVGAEINAGFSDTIFTGSTAKVKDSQGTTTTKNKVGGHDFSGDFGVTPLFRIGWAF